MKDLKKNNQQLSYVITDGEFEEKENIFIYHGKEEERTNPSTNEITKENAWGKLLFSNAFRSGKISFDVTFEGINDYSHCGIIFDYKYVDNKEFFYQMIIRNRLGLFGLDYFNGGKWEFKGFGGNNNTLKANQKYHISLEIQGNILRFFINDVCVYTYSSFISSASTCGICVSNNTNVIIENVEINPNLATVFSIMKFEKDFDELYTDVIIPKCKEFGYRSVRADECYTTTAIIQDIIKEISEASVIIADVTMDNPNVFYELGYAHALKKPTILLADVEKREKLPFDISGQRVVFYNNSIGGKKDIEKKLEKYFENINSYNNR